MSPSDEALDLRLSLLRLGDAKEAAKWNFAVPFNEELRSKAGKSLEWPGLVIFWETSVKVLLGERLGSHQGLH